MEAEDVYKNILKIRHELRLKQRTVLDGKQRSELNELEDKFNDDFGVFNDEWDKRMEEYKQHCLNYEQDLKDKHVEEFEKTQRNLEETIPVIPKHSSEFLNLKRIQDTLVRNKEYREAHAVQEKMKTLEEQEKMTWGKDRTAKIQMNLGVLVKKQENEQLSYKQKAMNTLEEMKKQRAVEMEYFIKRYQNIKKELEVSHRVEVNKFEGRHTTGSGIYKADASIANKLIHSPKSLFAKQESPLEQED